MTIAKSTLGLALAAAYLLLAALALVADLTRGPTVVILPDMIDLVSLPGLMIVVFTEAFGVPAGLLGKTAQRVVAVALTALLAYLLGAGLGALLKLLSVRFK